MMFRRRRGPLHPDQLREYVAPRKGFLRGMRYMLMRLKRLPGSPHKIALGFACGVFASFTPLFGLHILLGLGIAALLRGHLLAAVLGTVTGNPITFPFIAATSIRIGNLLLGTEAPAEGSEVPSAGELLLGLPRVIDSIFLPYLVGGLVPGLIAGVGGYVVVRSAVVGWRVARRSARSRRQRRRERPRPANPSEGVS